MESKARLFKNPTSQYRGKPFWSWNGKLDKQELLRQIEVMRKMGMGGYFCHSRTGLVTEYLGEEWFDLINACADKGSEENLETWLYDEDRWPSGTAGGLVTKNPEYRIKYIRLEILDGDDFIYDNAIIAFTAELDGFSFKDKQKVTADTDVKGKTVLKFTIEEMESSCVYNGYTYVDTMNRGATEKFIELTHEKYREKCGDRLGTSISGIFTDEPHRGSVMNGFSVFNKNAEFLTPYTDSLFIEFEKKYGYSLLENLPELYLWENGEKVHPVKWQYMELLEELFINNFVKPIYEWCNQNNLKLTGHFLHEDTLTAQSCMIGSIMRLYEYMDVPGVDVLSEGNCNFWIVKQLQSVCRQLNKKWMLSELYGCTGWQMNFESHKAVGDWQALLGINMRCHHLSWYSMKGEAKRDYPASILHQSAWYKDYKYIEDYFSRIHVIMEAGKPVCNLLVINPVESAWATIYPKWSWWLGTFDETILEIEEKYRDAFHILSGAKVDFDYGDEDILKRYYSIEQIDGETVLRVGNSIYTKVLIIPMLTIRSSTLEILREFAEKGGKVIFAGNIPQYIDAVKKDLPQFPAVKIPFEEKAIISQVNEDNIIEVIDSISGDIISDIYAQIKDDNGEYTILLMNINRVKTYENVLIRFNKGGYLEHWDARTGNITLAAKDENEIQLKEAFYPLTEKIYRLVQKDNGYKYEEEKITVKEQKAESSFEFKLYEPNVAVLDFAEYKLDGKSFEKTEILKIDELIRSKFGYKKRDGEMIQPWFKVNSKQSEICHLQLDFPFKIKDMPNEIYLAMETPEEFIIKVNGKAGTIGTHMYWVDKCFHVLKIDNNALNAGENIITLELNFREDIDLEAIYLLGDFAVSLDKNLSILSTLPKKVTIGDLTKQGFPFYGAAIGYKIINVPNVGNGEELFLQIDSFEGACIKAAEDISKIIAFQPYEVNISEYAGESFELKCILTRRNTFGPHHTVSNILQSVSPADFRTQGDCFLNDGYSLIESGILSDIRFCLKK